MTSEVPPPKPHQIEARIYYEDTDAGGIVYHANYLKYAERGRTEFLRAVGFDHHQVRAAFNLMLVVRHVELDYRASAVLDDLLTITSSVSEIGNTSLKMKQIVSCGEKILTEINVVLVAVSGVGRAVRIPPQLRQIFGGV